MWIEHRIDDLPITTLNEIARLLNAGSRNDYLTKLGRLPQNNSRGSIPQRIYISDGSSGKLTTDAFLIVWHPQGKTVGTWVAIHRDNDSKELKLWPEIPITRSNYKLTTSEKRKVDRQGRIRQAKHLQNFVDRNSMLPFPELQVLPTVVTTKNLDFQSLYPLLLNPDIVGYPIVSEENYIINYNTIMSRSFLNRS